MSAFLIIVGVVCLIAGSICSGAALISHRIEPSLFKLWFAGAAQQKKDYTPTGWRLLWCGTALAVCGIVLLIASDELSRELIRDIFSWK